MEDLGGLFNVFIVFGILLILFTISCILGHIRDIFVNRHRATEPKIQKRIDEAVSAEREKLKQEYEKKLSLEKENCERAKYEMTLMLTDERKKNDEMLLNEQKELEQQRYALQKKAEEIDNITSLLKPLPIKMNTAKREEYLDAFCSEKGLKAISEDMSFYDLENIQCSVHSEKTNNTYKTSLYSCTCDDNKYRHVVCKHMILLAIHVNAFDVSTEQLRSRYGAILEKISSSEKELRTIEKNKRKQEKSCKASSLE